MLHIQKDAWFWGQDGGTAVTALSLAGALAAGLCLCLCARVRGFWTTMMDSSLDGCHFCPVVLIRNTQ